MRRLCATALSILLAMGWLTSPLALSTAQAVTPAKPIASPGHPVRGVAFSVTGKLTTKVARPVSLQRKSGSKWVTIATTRTSSSGRYSFSVTSAASTTQLRVDAPKTKVGKKTYSRLTSKVNTVKTVAVTPASPIAGETFTVVESLGKKGARPASLQQLSGKTWRTIATTKTTSAGTATFTASLSSSASLRVYAPKTKIKKKTYSKITVATFKVAISAQSGTLALPSTGVAGQALIAEVQFSPVRAGRTVELQQLNGSDWVTVATGTQDAAGKATLGTSPATPGTFTYRATTSAYRGAPALSSSTAQAVIDSGIPEPSIVIGTLDPAVIGDHYHSSLEVSGGTAPYSWSATGLPEGMSLSSDGTLDGTPTTPGTYDITISLTDANGKSTHTTTQIVVVPAVAITDDSLPTGIAGQTYSATLTGSGGTKPYHWSADGLPSGLSISDDGVISGTTAVAGDQEVTLTITDGKGNSDTRQLTLSVGAALSLTTENLPNGTSGIAYSTTLAAAGGATPYTWAATGLPTGLSMDADTGTITGTPTQAGTFDAVTITVTDDNGYTDQATFTIVVAAAFGITTTDLPDGVVGTEYAETTLATIAGTAPYTWSATGLPNGLALGADTGAITGTPTEAGTFDAVKITVTDSASHSTEATLSITVAPAVHITTTSLPNGVVGTAYVETTLTAADGNSAGYTWLAKGLPAGLSLATDGTLTGTPTEAGTYDTVRLTVTDADGATAETTLTISVAPAVHITTTSLPNGVVGTDYPETTLAAADGNAASYTWTSTTLPDGLSLSSSGVISGVPTSSGVYDAVKVTVTDHDGATAETTFSLTIAQAVHITTASLPGGVVGTAYAETTLAAADGTPGYTWTATGLPNGLSVDADTGTITGTPTEAGTFATVKITVTDTVGKKANAEFSLTISPAVSVATSSLPHGVVGTDYEATLAAADGNAASYTWTATGLPAGLNLATDGTITGAPTEAGTDDVTVTVTDAAGKTAQRVLSITVVPAVHVTTTSLASGVVGTDYEATLAAADGNDDFYFWSAANLPDGLTLNGNTGVITGTPTTAGTTDNVTITVTDAAGKTAEATLPITIAPAVHITTTSLPAGVVGTSYTATIEAADGTAPYTWTAADLPTGLALSEDGTISGTPSHAGSAWVAFTVTDKNGKTHIRDLQFVANPAVHITTSALPDAVVDELYPETTLAAADGTAPYTWAATGLPAGVSLDANTGVLSGTPTEAGTSSAVKVTVTDDNGKTDSVTFTLTIHAEISVITATLNEAIVGESYSATLSGLGGTLPYTWTIADLPEGLALDSSTGEISGIPTTAGPFDLDVTLTDDHAKVATTTLTLTVRPRVSITTDSLAAGVVGTDYHATVTASGGTAPYSWSASNLPLGLSVDTDGQLSGTPSESGTSWATFTVTDAHGTTDILDISMTIDPALHITTTSLPDGVVDTAYSAALTAADGNGAVTWSATTLPAGLSLDAETGELTGTPEIAGSTTVTFTATDPQGKTATWETSLQIVPAVHVTNTSLPVGVVGTEYTATLTSADGHGPMIWSATDLPAGLSLDSNTGVISGIPTTAGTTEVTFAVHDQDEKTENWTFSMVIAPAVHITTDSLPSIEVGDDYPSTTLTAADGTPGYTWTSTALPNGLQLSTDGTLTGSPTTADATTVTFTVTDGNGATATAELTITITASVHITTEMLPTGVIGGDYTSTLDIAGGTAPYTVSTTTLPTGLSLTEDTISGTPTTASLNTPVEVTVTDARNKTSVTDFTLTVVTPKAESAGTSHTCAITPSGGIECWGINVLGQLGDGTTADSNYPVPVTGLDAKAISVAAGANHTCALLATGAVQCWGGNSLGQLGNGTTSSNATSTAQDVPDLDGVVSIAAGQYFTCATLDDGTARCWGMGTQGQLGTGMSASSNIPALVANLSGVIDVEAGNGHACALTNSGTVSCWGRNNVRQLGAGVAAATTTLNTPAAVPDVSGVAAVSTHLGSHTCAITNTGVVKCWGANGYGQLGTSIAISIADAITVAGLTDAVNVTAGGSHSCALTSTGSALCWGVNNYGQLGVGTTSNYSATPATVTLANPATTVAAGASHTCARDTTGAVECWGSNSSGQLANGIAGSQRTPLTAAGLNGLTSIDLGTDFACGLTATGGVKCWGSNVVGQLGNGTTTSSVDPVQVNGLTSGATALTVSEEHACALLSSGEVQCWGQGTSGQLGNNAAANSSTPVTPQGLSSGAVSVATGVNFSCAVLSDGTAECWGTNNFGQLGNGTNTTSLVPHLVSSLSDATTITAGTFHACVTTTGGAVKCWGNNGDGEVGDGNFVNRTTPTQVTGLTSGATAVSATDSSSCAIVNASVQCWGSNNYGQLGDGSTSAHSEPAAVTGLTNVTRIESGSNHVCTISTDGGLKCWGGNGYGQLGDGGRANSTTPIAVSGLSSAVSSVGAGVGSTCATLTDGTVKCWGNNGSGQLGFLSNYSPTPATAVGFNASALVAGEIGLGSGVVGTAYAEVSLPATGGASPYTWTATGLPAGLSVSSAGVVSGTPTEAGTSEVTFTVTDVRGKTAETTASITIAPAVHITTTELPSGVIGTAYSTTLAAADGAAGYTWSSDVMPDGLSLSTDGVLSGTPTGTTPGTTMQITVTDHDGKTATQLLTIVITPVIHGAAALSSGSILACAITGSGGVECWGKNHVGQLGAGFLSPDSTIPVPVTGLGSGVRAVSSGAAHACALTDAGGVKCWGTNQLGQLGDGSPMGLRGDSTPYNSATPVDVVGLTSGVQAISAGANHTCAVTIAGALKCWGYNVNGALGNNSTTNSNVPVDVVGLASGIAAVAGTNASTCALTTAGGVKCWGSNASGQLGDGTFTDRWTPVDVSLGSGVTAVSLAARGRTACVVTDSSGLLCWGYNGNGELGNGLTTDSATPGAVTDLTSGVAAVAQGQFHACALTTSGAVKCWGDNTSGEVGDGTTTNRLTPVDVTGLSSGVSSISVGSKFACAVLDSGAAKCWGDNAYGQVGDGSHTNATTPTGVFGYGPVAVQVPTSGVLPGEVGLAYPATTLLRAGGRAPYTWSASGLPSGLSLGAHTGVLSGTPTEAVTEQSVTITLTDADGATAHATVKLTVTGAVTLTTTSLPSGLVNTAYTDTTLAATGGVGPYTWSASNLPAGLSLNAATGVISGTPTNPSSSSVVVTATDHAGYAATATLPVTVLAIEGAASDFISLDASVSFSCGLTNVGGAQCWGTNAYGRLGDGTTTNRSTPVDVVGLTSGVKAVATGSNHACAITSSGGVECWGVNTYGQLGISTTTTSSNTPVAVAGLTDVTAITAGVSYTCALTSTGGVKCWGFNTYGQLGNGSTTSSSTPVDVSGLTTGVTSVTAGARHACVITSTGAAMCWGQNTYGALGTGNTTDATTPTSVPGLTSGVAAITAGAYHTCAITSSGGAQCWGYNVYGQLGNGTTTDSSSPHDVPGLTSGVASIAAGNNHTCAITTAGATTCWGYNYTGQLGNDSTINSSTPVEVIGLSSGTALVAPGADLTCAITSSHDVACWGGNAYGQLGNGSTSMTSSPQPVTALSTGISSVATGYTHSCALTTTGGVECWGNNSFGQLGNGTLSASSTPTVVAGLSSGVTAVAGGVNHTCALTSAGGVKCWGSNSNGQLGNGTTTDSTIPVNVTGLTGVTAITAGGTHTCALTSTGGIKCWGNNFAGAVGDGTTADRYVPVDVSGLTSGVTAVSAGGSHTCALTSTGGIKCWGYNATGELGNGTTTSATTPVAVNGLTSGVTGIDAGGSETCAVTNTGGVKCWGYNVNGQLGNGTTTDASSPVDVTTLSTGVAAINVGGYHVCARTTAGGLKCWGQGAYGQLGNGSTSNTTAPVDVTELTSDVAGVSAGNYHTCAVTNGGAVTCWGNNAAGQLGNGASTLVPGAVSGHSYTAPLRVTTLALPTGMVGSGYSANALAAGGTGSYTWTSTGLPNGLSLNASTGAISGTPTSAGTASVVLTVTDGAGRTGSATLAISVTIPVELTTTSVPAGVAGTAYSSTTLTATGGVAPYSWSATGLPSGMSLNSSTGVLSGTPSTIAANPTVTISVTDSASSSDQTQVALPVTQVAGATSDLLSMNFYFTHTCAVTNLGGVKCWGANNGGQLGDGTVTNRAVATDVIGLSDPMIAVASGNAFTCAVSQVGEVWCWGTNASGQLGDGTTTSRRTPAKIPGLTGAIDITAGAAHACVLTDDSAVKCWGVGTTGQLGDGGTSSQYSPVSVIGITNATQVHAGGSSTCALLATGSVKCWGSNTLRQLGDTTTTTRPTPVSVNGLTNATDLAVGTSHACAATATGTVTCWGGGTSGQLGDGKSAISDPVSVVGLTGSAVGVAAGNTHSCAVITDGTVDCWGANSNGTLGLDLATTGSSTATLAPLASGIAQIFASNDRTCGLTTTRDAVCWGTGSSGGLGNGLSVNEPTPQTVTAVSTTVTSLATGANHTCASTSTGGVRCWGQGTAGQLGLGSANTYTGVDVPNLPSNVTSVAGGSQFSCALSSGGAVMCWGANTGGQLGRGSVDSPNTTSSTTPVSVTGLSSGVTAITTGWAHACALMSDSTVKCWGGNASGQLGIGTSTDVSYPVAVPGLTGVVAISAGMNHTCAVTSAGAAWCWGANTYGALGDGTTTLQKSPQLVPTLGSGVVSISAGTSYTCAVLTGGAVQCWGYNNAGQLGLGNTTNATTPQPVIADGMTAVTTGSGHTCALATDGSARCWGGNTNGQLGAGDLGTHSTPTLVSGLTNVSAIRAGGQHTCAVSTTGVLTCWGSNTYSALGINTAAFPAPQTVLGVRS